VTMMDAADEICTASCCIDSDKRLLTFSTVQRSMNDCSEMA
jgi:hypothetical protein